MLTFILQITFSKEEFEVKCGLKRELKQIKTYFRV